MSDLGIVEFNLDKLVWINLVVNGEELGDAGFDESGNLLWSDEYVSAALDIGRVTREALEEAARKLMAQPPAAQA